MLQGVRGGNWADSDAPGGRAEPVYWFVCWDPAPRLPSARTRRKHPRVDNENKYWKFSPTDLKERAHWDEYIDAFEAALTATSTSHAPWYVIPADQKHIMRTMAAAIVVKTIQSLDLSYPTVGPEKLELIEKARAELMAEGPA